MSRKVLEVESARFTSSKVSKYADSEARKFSAELASHAGKPGQRKIWQSFALLELVEIDLATT